MQTLKKIETNEYLEKETSKIQFATGNTLFVHKQSGEIKLKDKNNELQLVINVTDNGLIINANVAELNLNASEQINLTSKKINIEAQEILQLKSNGNLIQQVQNDALQEIGGVNKSVAKIQKIIASLGNVEVKANDDVKLDGEAVKLNCEE